MSLTNPSTVIVPIAVESDSSAAIAGTAIKQIKSATNVHLYRGFAATGIERFLELSEL